MKVEQQIRAQQKEKGNKKTKSSAVQPRRATDKGLAKKNKKNKNIKKEEKDLFSRPAKANDQHC